MSEKHRRRFGEIAVAERYCAQEDVEAALERQEGTSRYIGAIMVEMGVLKVWQLEKVVALQKAEDNAKD
jgi:hypothetical protein